MKQPRSGQTRRVLVPLTTAVLLSACTHWGVSELAPSQVVAENERVRLTTADGDNIELLEPSISDGQIVGHPVRGRYTIESDTVRVPVNSVAYIQVRQFDALGFLGLVVGVAAVAGAAYAIAAAIALSSW